MGYTQELPVFEYSPLAPSAIVGSLGSAASGYIEVWEDRVQLPLTASGLSPIGTTGKFCWSTANLPPLTRPRHQYHWRMRSYDGGDSCEGDVAITLKPHAVTLPSSASDYAVDPRV